MMHHGHRLAIGLLATLLACGGVRTPPVRTSPVPVVVTPDANVTLVDLLRSEPAWYDAGRDRVMWLRNGAVEVVADVGVQAMFDQPTGLRVFDDRSFLVYSEERVVVFPASGAPQGLDVGPFLDARALDGTSVDDFWYLFLPVVSPDPNDLNDRLCHHLAAAQTDACVPVTNTGGFSRTLVRAADGSLYLGQSDGRPYRYSGGKLEAVDGWPQTPIDRFRRTGSSVLAMASDQSAYVIEGLNATELHSPSVLDVIGSADDYFYVTIDQETAKVDPQCGGLFSDCPIQTLWSQAVYWHVTSGNTTELAHETCDASPSCDSFVYTMGVENGQLYAVGSSVRRTPVR